MEIIYKIRDKKTGLFKRKRSLNMNAWSKTGDLYIKSVAEGSLKSMIHQRPEYKGRLEIVSFGLVELKKKDDNG